jgi:uncharacterized protein YbcV (DUF1398 family)
MNCSLNVSVLLESTRLSFAGQQTFPQTVAELSKIGIERYLADLTRLEKTHYSASGESVTIPLPLADAAAVASEWRAEGVIAAIRAIQQRQIEFRQFLRQIMGSGCVAYWVFLSGRKALYFGRGGEFHVEPFPAAQ